MDCEFLKNLLMAEGGTARGGGGYVNIFPLLLCHILINVNKTSV